LDPEDYLDLPIREVYAERGTQIVKKEKIDPISLNIKPPSNKR